jgi:hypothetical protein
LSSPLSPSAELEVADAITFWQREVHYYEGRAAEQGASANRLVTLAAGAVAVVPLVVTLLNGTEPRVYLLVVPAIVIVLWATAVRLLHEMAILRAYREHAEWRLTLIARPQQPLRGYVSWHEEGARFDRPLWITLAWSVSAGALSLAGLVGIPLAVLAPFDGWTAAILGVEALFAAAILYTLLLNRRDAGRMRTILGVPRVGRRP